MTGWTTTWTPAHRAVELEDAQTLARLLADGADPNEVFGAATLLTHALDVEGDGALQSRQPLTVHTTAILLAFGADPQLRDPAGDTPMDVAEEYDHQPAIKLLTQHIAPVSHVTGRLKATRM
ncbi:ankyrin repeat domain-containing protein [Streptomyces sp. Caat 7-52]|uniref:ankyrin repeat domain-containing protein n=1 Tax=Streptomyces sp. Caat 7-52 TaxID=2949637 RepID=UPI0020353EF9|nr:ankyrin repeat domain-containing protein [Streptomyces sp. Caat 7-52]